MLSLNPSALYTSHVGQVGGRGLSPRVWAQSYGQALSPDGQSNAYGLSDDFMSFGPSMAVAANVGYYASEGGLYKTYEDTGGACAQSATEVGGVMNLSVDADGDQEAWITSGGGAGVLGVVSDTAGSAKLMLFEQRFKVTQAAMVGNLYVGLSEEALAVADTIDDDGDLASKDFLGFAVNEDTPTLLDLVYRKAGGALVTKSAGIATLTSGTYVKVGLVYNPFAAASKRITAFVNNVEVSAFITATDIATATFPDGEELAWLTGCKNVTDTMTLSTDWFSFLQAG